MGVDLISDVMRSANPDRAAKAQLNLAKAGGPDDNLFSRMFGKLKKSPNTPATISSGGDLIQGVLNAGNKDQVVGAEMRLASIADKTTPDNRANLLQAKEVEAQVSSNVGKELESAVLTSLLETIVPMASEETYGTGTAGEMIRSLQVQQFADAAADKGILELAIADPTTSMQQQANLVQSVREWPYFVVGPITSFVG